MLVFFYIYLKILISRRLELLYMIKYMETRRWMYEEKDFAYFNNYI